MAGRRDGIGDARGVLGECHGGERCRCRDQLSRRVWHLGRSAPATPRRIYTEPTGKCLEDGLGGAGVPNYTPVDQICNQGGNVQVANCFYTTEPNNSSVANDDTVQSGLHFIREFSTPGAGAGAPELHSAYLTSNACSTGYGSAYFAAFPKLVPRACPARWTSDPAVVSE